jgi:hypothetical protein
MDLPVTNPRGFSNGPTAMRSGATNSGAPDTATDDTGEPTPVVDTGTPNEPPKVTGIVQRCQSNDQCSGGVCVEGICCDRACDGTCESCLMPFAPGKCTPVPLGLDPKGQCGAAGSCLSTCDGAGKCRTAFPGTQCAPTRCTGATGGVGAAYCVAVGAACPEQTVPFDCGAYACEKALGACYARCTSSAQCASGNVCDVASGQCSAAPPAAEEGGCSVTRRGAATSRGGALLVTTLVALGRRRRRTTNRAV